MPAHDLVVVGSSWGGLNALRILLADLPPGFSTPIVLAQHQSASTTGEALAASLQKGCALEVRVIHDKDVLSPATVFVAPPDYHVLVESGGLALSVDARVMFSRPSIDVLFESAAVTYGHKLVGVILTGSNADGAAGLATVRARGGITIVQDPSAALHPAMPESAIAASRPNRVLPLEEIAPFLTTLCTTGTVPDAPRAEARSGPRAQS
jgi:two-component system, chemotaxis family, protein-glutamate methylesterase/glutaminase